MRFHVLELPSCMSPWIWEKIDFVVLFNHCFSYKDFHYCIFIAFDIVPPYFLTANSLFFFYIKIHRNPCLLFFHCSPLFVLTKYRGCAFKSCIMQSFQNQSSANGASVQRSLFFMSTTHVDLFLWLHSFKPYKTVRPNKGTTVSFCRGTEK